MTTILFVRHGQSEANLSKHFAGHWNVELTELGKKQAKLTAEFIAENYTPTAVYASDLVRAYETGKAVSDLLSLPITTNEGLREIDAGEWEEKHIDELYETFEDYKLWRADIGNSRPTGGESVIELSERFYKTVCEIAKKHDGETIVIATHATPIRSIETRIAGRGYGYMKNIPWVTNASVSEVIFEDGRLCAVKMAQDEHLGVLTSKLSSRV